MKGLLTGILIIIIGSVAGMILERLFMSKIKKLVQHRKLNVGKIIINALKGRLVFLTILFSIFIAIPYLKILNIPNEIIKIISKSIVVSILFVFTLVLQKFLSGVVINYFKISISASTSIFKNIINIVVFILGLFIIFQTIGIKITALITALGIGGLAVALALQDTLSNLFSGLHIIAVQQIKVGDYIKLESGEAGYVTDIGWRNTTIRMLPNNIIIMPNSKIASSIIINYNLPETEMAVLVNVGVSYDSDLEKVENVTIKVAKEVMKEVEGGVPEFEPFIRYNKFADFSINFTVIMRAKEFVAKYLIIHEFIKRLHKRYNKEGIVIPFPIRTVYLPEKKKK